jgi:ATP adenylyltransferase
MEYIQRPEKKDTGCVFCEAQAAKDGPENQIVYRGQNAYVILNRYPYTSGHVMVVPFAHQPSLDLLGANVRSEIMELANQSIQIIQSVYEPQGFNIGFNIGSAAGAGILGHVHMHVVPRWQGDTNFMSTLSMTRVIPENLEDTFFRLKQAWDKLTSPT